MYGQLHANLYWLSQTVFALVDKAAGATGLRILTAALAALAPLAFVLVGRSLSRSWLAGAVAGWLALLAQIDRVRLRPDLFAAAGLAALFWLLADRAHRFRSKRWLIRLFGLTWLWMNLHPSALLVPVFVAVVGIADWLQTAVKRRKPGSGADPATQRHIIVSVLLTLLATLLTPATIHAPLAAITIGNDLQAIVGEWQSFLVLLELRPFMILLPLVGAVGCIAVLLTKLRRSALHLDWSMLTASLLAFAFAFSRARFCIYFLWLVCFTLMAWPQLQPRASRRLRAIAVAICLAAAATIGVYRWPYVAYGWSHLGQDHSAHYAPVGATAFLKDARVVGALGHQLGWGGYLSLHLYPQCLIEIDGRMELFGSRRLKENQAVYQPALSADHLRWKQAVLDRLAIDVLVVEPTFFWLTAPERSKWLLVYADQTSTSVFLRRDRLSPNLERVCRYYRERGVDIAPTLPPPVFEQRVLQFCARH